jgi:hypothetical protein
MGQHRNRPDLNQEKDAPSLKGTLVGVLILAGFIAVSWFSVYFLYLSRM